MPVASTPLTLPAMPLPTSSPLGSKPPKRFSGLPSRDFARQIVDARRPVTGNINSSQSNSTQSIKGDLSSRQDRDQRVEERQKADQVDAGPEASRKLDKAGKSSKRKADDVTPEADADVDRDAASEDEVKEATTAAAESTESALAMAAAVMSEQQVNAEKPAVEGDVDSAVDASADVGREESDNVSASAVLATVSGVVAAGVSQEQTSADPATTLQTDAVKAQAAQQLVVEAGGAQVAKAAALADPAVSTDEQGTIDLAGLKADASAAVLPDAESSQQESADLLSDPSKPGATGAPTKEVTSGSFEDVLSRMSAEPSEKAPVSSTAKPAVPTTPATPEQKFAEDNVDNVVGSVRTQVTAGGGQMRIRLDPPELGALEVAVKMIDGKLTAAFTTSNDNATQLLSHNLSHLKSSLEATGILVDRIQVRQAPADNNTQNQSNNQSGDPRNGAYDPHSRQGEQQRKEAIQRMWRKLAYGTDEVDLVA
jgi:flagellar hook-length control protein FliK